MGRVPAVTQRSVVYVHVQGHVVRGFPDHLGNHARLLLVPGCLLRVRNQRDPVGDLGCNHAYPERSHVSPSQHSRCSFRSGYCLGRALLGHCRSGKKDITQNMFEKPTWPTAFWSFRWSKRVGTIFPWYCECWLRSMVVSGSPKRW